MKQRSGAVLTSGLLAAALALALVVSVLLAGAASSAAAVRHGTSQEEIPWSPAPPAAPQPPEGRTPDHHPQHERRQYVPPSHLGPFYHRNGPRSPRRITV